MSPVAVKAENQLSADARGRWLKALSAFEQRNFGYVVELLRPVLREAPDFLVGRQLLRRAEWSLVKPRGGGSGGGSRGFLRGITGGGGLSLWKDRGLVKTDPRAALEAAEDALERDPASPGANLLLRDAALALGLPEVAGFALETLRDADPENPKTLHQLARHHLAVGQPERAVGVYQRIVRLNPTDLEAIQGGKDAAAAASIAVGGWEQASRGDGSYRDALKDKVEAVSLEREASQVKSVEVVGAQLDELYARHQESPQDLGVVRRIATLHEQRDDPAAALEWARYAVALTNGADPGLMRKVSDLTLRNLDLQIRNREDWLETTAAAAHHDAPAPGGTDADAIARCQGELEELRRQHAAAQVEAARQRVAHHPTDLTCRYELGEALLRAGEATLAIPELQRAAQSPSLGVRATHLLGQCFEAKHIVHLAVKQYETARGKLPTMDALKKEITYRVGLAYERTGDQGKYLARMTEIYEVDSGYRDVAVRVEGAYGE